MLKLSSHKLNIALAMVLVAIVAQLVGGILLSGPAEAASLVIKKGSGLSEIATDLYDKKVIKSKLAFEIYTVLTLNAGRLKPGFYTFKAHENVPGVVKKLIAGGEAILVTIPEGLTLNDSDEILSTKGVIEKHALIDYNHKLGQSLEGFLFPDTYKFFPGSDVQLVVSTFLDNFKARTQPAFHTSFESTPSTWREKYFGADSDFYKTLVLSSLVEREVSKKEDRPIVAGILQKRLLALWPLQVDATICYIKSTSCYPLTPLDFKIDSDYNTYLHKGLPPGPIGNPGLDAINAVLEAQKTNYWYYLSDPKTGRTYYAKTLEEQEKNRRQYLR